MKQKEMVFENLLNRRSSLSSVKIFYIKLPFHYFYVALCVKTLSTVLLDGFRWFLLSYLEWIINVSSDIGNFPECSSNPSNPHNLRFFFLYLVDQSNVVNSCSYFFHLLVFSLLLLEITFFFVEICVITMKSQSLSNVQL